MSKLSQQSELEEREPEQAARAGETAASSGSTPGYSQITDSPGYSQAASSRRQTPGVKSQTPDSRLQTPDLSVHDLRKAYRSPAGERIEVLRGVTFAARGGEAVAVMGASGAGKSTLLHLLGGLDEADSGSAYLAGREITRARGAELARLRNTEIGFVFQFHHLLADLTAAENVALPLLIARHSRREALAHARAWLDRVGLRERAAHRSGELSGGEQQRVAIARALVTEPRLLLADEPTGNLDARHAGEIGALLVSLARASGAVVILATHNQTIARLCARTLRLREGRLEESGV